MTYWSINAVFLGLVAVLVVVSVLRRRVPHWRAVGITAVVLLIMTAIFDNIMIGVGLVAYNPDLISGVFIGIAPLEDFAYTVAAFFGLPALWHLLARNRSGEPSPEPQKSSDA